MFLTRVILVALTALLSAACSREGKPPAPPAGAALVTLSVRAEPMPQETRLDGVIEAVNQGTLAAQTAGRVASIHYDVNDFVPQGAVVMRLRATEQRAGLAQAQAAQREAIARETEAQTQYGRIADMYARKVVAKAQLDTAAANRDAAVARLAAARAGLDNAREGVAYTEVRAPYPGVLTRRLVQVGETVAPGTPLFSGLSLQYLRVVVDVPQSIVAQVRGLKKAAVYLGEQRVEATRLTLFPEASAASNTFRARLELPPHAADLYPGMLVKVGIVTSEALRLLVPQAAVVVRSEVTAVYVVAADGRVSLRQVRLGHVVDGRVEVLAGLDAGERVALDPVAALKAVS